jgi:hypothetical protein
VSEDLRFHHSIFKVPRLQVLYIPLLPSGTEMAFTVLYFLQLFSTTVKWRCCSMFSSTLVAGILHLLHSGAVVATVVLHGADLPICSMALQYTVKNFS